MIALAWMVSFLAFLLYRLIVARKGYDVVVRRYTLMVEPLILTLQEFKEATENAPEEQA